MKPNMKSLVILLALKPASAFVSITAINSHQPTTTSTTHRNAASGHEVRNAIANSRPFNPIVTGSSSSSSPFSGYDTYYNDAHNPNYEESAAPKGECGRPRTFGGPSTKQGFVNESTSNANPFYKSFDSKPKGGGAPELPELPELPPSPPVEATTASAVHPEPVETPVAEVAEEAEAAASASSSPSSSSASSRPKLPKSYHGIGSDLKETQADHFSSIGSSSPPPLPSLPLSTTSSTSSPSSTWTTMPASSPSPPKSFGIGAGLKNKRTDQTDQTEKRSYGIGGGKKSSSSPSSSTSSSSSSSSSSGKSGRSTGGAANDYFSQM